MRNHISQPPGRGGAWLIMAFIDCNEQVSARKTAWPERPHCEHGDWYSSGKMWKSPKANRKWVLVEYHRRRKERIEFLGEICANCGADEDLEFDHVDPTTKAFNPSMGKYSQYSLSNPEIQTELAKCQLLCKHCHRAKTGQEASQKATAKKDQLEALINQYESEAA